MTRPRATAKAPAGNGGDFGPALTAADVEASERAEAGSGEWALRRRVTFAVLTRSADELRGAWQTEDGQAAMLDALRVAAEWREHVRAGLAVADLVIERLTATGNAVAEGRP